MTLKDVAIRGVETAGPDASVPMLANTMDEKGVGSVVITEENRVVGIVTDRDVALTLAREADPTTLTAADVMASEPLTMPHDAGLLELVERMDVESVRRVPIVDDNGVIVGIVTLDDLVRLLSVELEHLASIVEAESP
ncbi:CBS domain-containing protein [Salinigranum rubrum]|uniref:CBS domain-containing protein n=1 Tax=Salinigranum rubrum TaxID=755307 RepID=A0A2I8VP99_9EURY|nr:CBS domain-containing protein [Salinigranum rubrum]AUV83751.1 CBS domain-containing protein [Salinigranum rubrum]